MLKKPLTDADYKYVMLDLEKVALVETVTDCKNYRAPHNVGSGIKGVYGSRFESAQCSVFMMSARKCNEACPRMSPERAISIEIAQNKTKLVSARTIARELAKKQRELKQELARVLERDTLK